MNLWHKLSPTKQGQQHELEALKLLQSAGLKLLMQNYRTKTGEIDIVMKDKDTLVFVEVRYRKNIQYGDGAATITKQKQSRITKAAQAYIQQYHYRGPCRFDVVALSAQHSPDWIQNAFETQ